MMCSIACLCKIPSYKYILSHVDGGWFTVVPRFTVRREKRCAQSISCGYGCFHLEVFNSSSVSWTTKVYVCVYVIVMHNLTTLQCMQI